MSSTTSSTSSRVSTSSAAVTFDRVRDATESFAPRRAAASDLAAPRRMSASRWPRFFHHSSIKLDVVLVTLAVLLAFESARGRPWWAS